MKSSGRRFHFQGEKNSIRLNRKSSAITHTDSVAYFIGSNRIEVEEFNTLTRHVHIGPSQFICCLAFLDDHVPGDTY